MVCLEGSSFAAELIVFTGAHRNDPVAVGTAALAEELQRVDGTGSVAAGHVDHRLIRDPAQLADFAKRVHS